MKADLIDDQNVVVEEAIRVPVWTGGAASKWGEVVHVCGIQMIKKRKTPTGSKGGGASDVQAEQGNLWLELPTHHPHEKTVTSSMSQPSIAILGKPR